jgi:hypothetical protein
MAQICTNFQLTKKGRNLYNGKLHKKNFSLEWRLNAGGMSGMDLKKWLKQII